MFDAGVPWGTSGVMAATVQRLRDAGLRWETLAPWYDVDDARGLERLARSVADASDLPHTRAALVGMSVAPAS